MLPDMLHDFNEGSELHNEPLTRGDSEMEDEPTPKPRKKGRQISDSEDEVEQDEVEDDENFQTPLMLKRSKVSKRLSFIDSSLSEMSDSGDFEDETDKEEKNTMTVVRGKDAHKQAKVNIKYPGSFD
jgi:hypothetical protein